MKRLNRKVLPFALVLCLLLAACGLTVLAEIVSGGSEAVRTPRTVSIVGAQPYTGPLTDFAVHIQLPF